MNKSEALAIIENQEGEIWVQLYDLSMYQLSNFGRIRSIIYEQSIGVRNGVEYFRTKPMYYKKLRTNGIEPFYFTDVYKKDEKGNRKQKTIYIHRAVADHFVIKPKYILETESKGGHIYASHVVKDYQNNRFDNIRWKNHIDLMRSQPQRLADPTKAWRTRREKYGNNWGCKIKPTGRIYPKKEENE